MNATLLVPPHVAPAPRPPQSAPPPHRPRAQPAPRHHDFPRGGYPGRTYRHYSPFIYAPPLYGPVHVPPPAYYTPPPVYYAPPPVYVPAPRSYYDSSAGGYIASPPAYVERDGEQYFCTQLGGYYPYVTECPGPWERLPPQ